MIDLIHNETVGFTLIHDEPSLVGARRILVSREGRCRFVEASGRVRSMPNPVPADLHALLKTISKLTMIHMSGFRALSIEPVQIYSA